MFRKHPKATPVDLQEGLVGWIPPVGIVWDHFTNKWVETDVYVRSAKKADQYWEAEREPEWYKKKRREEEREILRTENPDFFIEECEQYRQSQWFKRLNGMWFMNNGEPTYITGLHWFYMSYWPMDIGLPHFFEFDKYRFYHMKYCIDDPKCYGRVEVGPRRTGKTFAGGVFAFEYTSRSSFSLSGIQSKTVKDAKNIVFARAMVSQFRKLPHFFKPVYDTSQGSIPKSSIRFFNTSKKGRGITIEDMEPELESVIDFESSGTHAYDGAKLHRYLGDEIFKTVECDVYERHKVVKECLVNKITKEIIGKANYTSTVEEVEGSLETYEKFWNKSDPNKRNKNGQTETGLYRYFISAADTGNLNKYGVADREKNILEITNEVEGIDDQKDKSDFRRKNPLSIKDAFRPKSTDCQYNVELLENRYDLLSIFDPKYITGDLRWIDPDDITQGVKFVPLKNGNFKLHKDIDYNSGEWNNVTVSGSMPMPRNKAKFIGGNDPFDNKTTVDNRKSNGSTVMFYKFDPMNPDKSDKFVLVYCYRPKKPSIFYEDTLKIAWFFGCQILMEDNKKGIIQYFEWANPFGMNLKNFMVHLPDRKEPGIPTTEQTHDSIVNHTREYIEDCIDLVDYPELITDWLKFDINKTTKFDLSMSSGICLIAADRIRKKKVVNNNEITEISDIFTMY